MPNNVPARIPVRAEREVATASTPCATTISDNEALAPVAAPFSAPPASSSLLVLDRRALSLALRFASRLAANAPIPALKACLFTDGSLVATDLDVALRARIGGACDLGVLVPVEPFKRCVVGSRRAEVEITRLAPTDDRPFAVSVDGAVLSGHDPQDFPDPSMLFPNREIRAQALFQTLEPVLAAAAIEESRKSMNAVLFELCRNVAVATDGHRLHAIRIESSDKGDFLAPRKVIELVENVRRATRTAEVQVDFFEHQAVFHIGTFDVAVRLETEKFPAYQEVIPKQSKYELRVEKKALLEGLDRIAAVLNERSRGVRLRKVADGLEIHGKKPDAGELTITIAASGWKEGELLGVNLGYLHDASRFAPSANLTIGVTDENHPLKIADGAYLAIVMPLRLDKGEIP